MCIECRALARDHRSNVHPARRPQTDEPLLPRSNLGHCRWRRVVGIRQGESSLVALLRVPQACAIDIRGSTHEAECGGCSYVPPWLLVAWRGCRHYMGCTRDSWRLPLERLEHSRLCVRDVRCVRVWRVCMCVSRDELEPCRPVRENRAKFL